MEKENEKKENFDETGKESNFRFDGVLKVKS